jgi:hypothetical protein
MNKKQIDLLREFVNHQCEECHRTEFELSNKSNKIVKLQPHRIKQGGEYSLRNIKMVCKYNGKIDGKFSCHDIFSSAQNKARGLC